MHFNRRGLKIRQPAGEKWGFLASTTSIIKNHVSPASIPANDQYYRCNRHVRHWQARQFISEDKIILAGAYELKFFYLKTEK